MRAKPANSWRLLLGFGLGLLLGGVTAALAVGALLQSVKGALLVGLGLTLISGPPAAVLLGLPAFYLALRRGVTLTPLRTMAFGGAMMAAPTAALLASWGMHPAFPVPSIPALAISYAIMLLSVALSGAVAGAVFWAVAVGWKRSV